MLTPSTRLRRFCAALGALAMLALPASPPAAAARAPPRPRHLSARELQRLGSTTLFGNALAALGEWMLLADGRVAWRPVAVSDAWRPYVNGSWSSTPEGWYWVSEEPWGWATYHYGRWRIDPALGWIWIPGDEWAPAWVVWRYGAGAVGWAPRPDDGVVLPAAWTFLPARTFADVDVATAALPGPRAALLLARTVRAPDLAPGPRPLGAAHAVAAPAGLAPARPAALGGIASAGRAHHARR